METDEHVLPVVDVAEHHRHVDVSGRALEGADVEDAERRGKRDANRLAGDHAAGYLPHRAFSQTGPAGKLRRWRVAGRCGSKPLVGSTSDPCDVPPVGEGEVLVRTSFSGISAGTEMLAYRGELDPELPVDETIGALGGTFRYPFRYGYSCVGVVEESRSELQEGGLVFAFQPHQDVFVAKASDVVALGSVDAAAGDALPARRNRVADHVGCRTAARRDRGRVRPRRRRRLVGAPAPAGGRPGGRRRTPGVAPRRPRRARRGARLERRPGGGSELRRRVLAGADRDRSVGQSRCVALGVRVARPRRHRPGRLLVRQQGRVPPARPGVPPPPAHDPQHPGVDDSGRARQPMDSGEPDPRRRGAARRASPRPARHPHLCLRGRGRRVRRDRCGQRKG